MPPHATPPTDATPPQHPIDAHSSHHTPQMYPLSPPLPLTPPPDAPPLSSGLTWGGRREASPAPPHSASQSRRALIWAVWVSRIDGGVQEGNGGCSVTGGASPPKYSCSSGRGRGVGGAGKQLISPSPPPSKKNLLNQDPQNKKLLPKSTNPPHPKIGLFLHSPPHKSLPGGPPLWGRTMGQVVKGRR